MKVNVIGEDTNTYDIVNHLLFGALKYYGKRYKRIIEQAIKDTIFYEKSHDETMSDATKKICNVALPLFELPYVKSGNLSLHRRGKKVNYIIWEVTNTDLDYHTIAHELYAHGVCDIKRSYGIHNKEVFHRNGINVINYTTNKSKYRLLNEGMMETISYGIIDNMEDIKKTGSDLKSYLLATKCSDFLFDLVGKEELIHYLVHYKKIPKNLEEEDMDILDKVLRMIEKNESIKSKKFSSEKLVDDTIKELKIKHKA